MTAGDELIVAGCDLDDRARCTNTLIDVARYRRPEMYPRISTQKGAIHPE